MLSFFTEMRNLNLLVLPIFSMRKKNQESSVISLNKPHKIWTENAKI